MYLTFTCEDVHCIVMCTQMEDVIRIIHLKQTPIMVKKKKRNNDNDYVLFILLVKHLHCKVENRRLSQ